MTIADTQDWHARLEHILRDARGIRVVDAIRSSGNNNASNTVELVQDDRWAADASLHTGFSTIIAVHWLLYSRRAGTYVAGWCVLIIASTLLIHQHFIPDMVAGLTVSLGACWTALRIVGRPPTQVSERASSP